LFALLWKVTQQNNLILGAYDATTLGHKDITPSVIPLPIIASLNEETTFEEIIAQVKGQMIEASGHRTLFDSNSEYREAVSNTHTGVYLNSLCGVSDEAINIGEYFPQVSSYGSQNEVNIYLLMKGNQYEIRWQYQQRLFDHGTMQFWMNGWLNFVQKIIYSPNTKLSELKFQEESSASPVNPFFNIT